MIENYKNILTQKYADFSGRATRSEYWLFVLMNFCIGLASFAIATFFAILFSGVREGSLSSIIMLAWYGMITLYSLIIMIPHIAVGVRRLHDVGQSGWLYLIGFIPFGGLALLVLFCMDSDINANQYGPNTRNQKTTNSHNLL